MIWFVVKLLLIAAALVAIGIAAANRLIDFFTGTGKSTPNYDRAGLAGLAVLLVLLVAGCGGGERPVREITVIKEVPVPYHLPCPKAGDKPVVPKRVAEETPVLPTLSDGSPDWQKISRVLGDKVLELFGYAAEADGVMTECGKQRGAAPPR